MAPLYPAAAMTDAAAVRIEERTVAAAVSHHAGFSLLSSVGEQTLKTLKTCTL